MHYRWLLVRWVWLIIVSQLLLWSVAPWAYRWEPESARKSSIHCRWLHHTQTSRISVPYIAGNDIQTDSKYGLLCIITTTTVAVRIRRMYGATPSSFPPPRLDFGVCYAQWYSGYVHRLRFGWVVLQSPRGSLSVSAFSAVFWGCLYRALY